MYNSCFPSIRSPFSTIVEQRMMRKVQVECPEQCTRCLAHRENRKWAHGRKGGKSAVPTLFSLTVQGFEMQSSNVSNILPQVFSLLSGSDVNTVGDPIFYSNDLEKLRFPVR